MADMLWSEVLPPMPAYSTSKSVFVTIVDTLGAPETGLAFNTAGILATGARSASEVTDITLATLADQDSAWSSGGFIEVDAAKLPGVYRLDVPNALLLGGADEVVITIWKSATFHGQVRIPLSTEDVVNPNTTRTDN
jgi:hypothetical protein